MKINPNRIRTLLAEKQLSQTEFAVQLGMAPTFVSAILTRGSCSIKTLGRIAAGLGTSAECITVEE